MSGTSPSKFTAATTVPNQESWGNYQRFNFSDTFPHVKLQAYSQFVPTPINTSTINIETRNSRYAGFRFQQLSQSSDANQFGSFYFQSFIGDDVGVNIFGFDGTNFDIYVPIDVNSNKISNLLPGVAGTDAVNLNQLSAVVAAGTITLTGNVTGSGVLNTPFATTLALRLNQITAPNASVSMSSQKLTSLANGTVSADAVNLGQMNTAISSAVSAGTITLTGNVTGSGTVGSPFATTIVSKLNQIPIPTGAVNINSQDIGNVGNLGIGVASPTFPIQFANATADCKIALYPGAGNAFQCYGFGVLGSTLKYSVDSSASSHIFYCGASSTTSTELFRIAGTGYATASEGDGTFYCRVPSIQININGSATTTALSSFTWTKLNMTSTTAATGSVQFTTTANRITFTGSDLGDPCVGIAMASVTIQLSTVTDINLLIYKNGSPVNQTLCWLSNKSTSVPVTVTLPAAMVTLSPGDYLEVWASGTGTTATTNTLNLTFMAC